ncbi:S1 RNA-binding domain-containing protein, partial [bacterium]|nr:S1 RNA-binding domain-containing protein [bacterium]
MVDVEKQTNDGMIGPDDPIKEGKGGELADLSSGANVQSKATKELHDSNDINNEEKKYSDEEYQNFVEFYDKTLSDIRQGEIVMGRILAVTDQEVLIDIGFKSEGSIPITEFDDPSEIKIGSKVEVYLETIEDADGQLILSKK